MTEWQATPQIHEETFQPAKRTSWLPYLNTYAASPLSRPTYFHLSTTRTISYYHFLHCSREEEKFRLCVDGNIFQTSLKFTFSAQLLLYIPPSLFAGCLAKWCWWWWCQHWIMHLLFGQSAKWEMRRAKSIVQCAIHIDYIMDRVWKQTLLFHGPIMINRFKIHTQICINPPTPRPFIPIIRKLQLPKGRFNIHPGSCVLFHDRVHTGHYPGHLVVYYVLAGVECCAGPVHDR